MGPRWGWFSLWFFKRSEVISFLVACVLQYLSAVEVNKGRKDGMGWFINLAAFLCCSILHEAVRSEEICCYSLASSHSRAGSR